jgi:hypothetical protein
MHLEKGREAGNGSYAREETALGRMVTSRPNVISWSDNSTSSGNYGWLFVFPGHAISQRGDLLWPVLLPTWINAVISFGVTSKRMCLSTDHVKLMSWKLPLNMKSWHYSPDMLRRSMNSFKTRLQECVQREDCWKCWNVILSRNVENYTNLMASTIWNVERRHHNFMKSKWTWQQR